MQPSETGPPRDNIQSDKTDEYDDVAVHRSDAKSTIHALLTEVDETQKIYAAIQRAEVKTASYATLPYIVSMLAQFKRFAEIWGEVKNESKSVSATEEYRYIFLELRLSLSAIRVGLIAINELRDYSRNVDSQIKTSFAKLLDHVPTLVQVMMNRIADDDDIRDESKVRVSGAIQSLMEQSQSTRLVLDAEIFEAARVASEQTVQLRDVARQAAGEVGALALGVHFENYATREREVADRLRLACQAVIVLVTLIAAGVLLVDGGSVEAVTSVEWARLALTLPLIALAGYLGREASRHRRIANWAAQREVQLKTLEAYASTMDDADRQRLRVDLGQRIFGVDQPDAYRQADAPSVGSDVGRIFRQMAPGKSTAESGGRVEGSSGQAERQGGSEI